MILKNNIVMNMDASDDEIFNAEIIFCFRIYWKT